MKPTKHIVLLLNLLMFFAGAYGQKKITLTPDPPRGHYNQLAGYDAMPSVNGADKDKLAFEHNPDAAARRLSLKPYYLENVSVDDFVIPAPPANSSAQTRAELNYLLHLQNQRREIDVQSSLIMAGIYYNPRVQPADSNYNAFRANLFHIGRSMGTWFNPENLPVTADFVAHVWQDASFYIWSLKYKYLRVRPYVLDPDLKNLEETNWPSYPSGHAANSYINAYLYRLLKPEFADVFLKDAYDMAHSREILGVHFPSDSEASRLFAFQFVQKLLKNEAFLKDLEQVRKEWSERARENFAKPEISTSKQKEKKPCASTCTQ